MVTTANTRSRTRTVVGAAVMTGLSILAVATIVGVMRDNPVSSESELPGLTVQAESAAGFEASLPGTLAVDESTNCVVVKTAVEPVDVAWPPGWKTSRHDGSVTLVNADGETVARVGDKLRITGGFVTPAAAHAKSCTESANVFAAWEVVRS
jgi:hypothetical protein